MYELEKVGSSTYYINCPAKIGVYVKGEDAYLIDSGNDKDAGKKIKRVLDSNGWHLKGIINTHSHADHIGGNHYLQQQTGCKVFAGGVEGAFTANPMLEPSLLYGGFPPKELCHKFLLAQQSNVTSFDDPDFPKELELIELKGHYFDMVGVRTPDDILFIADCVSSEATLNKYHIPFIYDVSAYVATLEHIKLEKATLFVPSHAEPTKDISAIADANIQKVLEIEQVILTLLEEPCTFEQLLSKVFSHYALTMTFEQHALVGSTLRSFLSRLHNSSRVDTVIEDNKIFYKKTR